MDQRQQSSSVPRQLGVMYPICRKAISRYQTSADIHQALYYVGVPTVFTKGWKPGDIETFTEINGGRGNVAFGAAVCNNLPGDVEIDLQSMDSDNSALFKQMEENQKECRN